MIYLPDNIKDKVNDPFYRKHIIQGNLLVYSHVSPYEKKTRHSFVAAAMERNKLIYAQAAATAIVKSDYMKGGTWSGAVETIKHNWGRVCVWDNKSYQGNQELIKMGGRSLDDNGNHIEENETENPVVESADNEQYEQLSIFDIKNE